MVSSVKSSFPKNVLQLKALTLTRKFRLSKEVSKGLKAIEHTYHASER